MRALARRFGLDERGQDLIEYMLLAAFVAVACGVAVTALGVAVSDVFDAIAAELETPGGA